ncbi:hypothetical protein D623_10021543 [Myotis brandtii]|uniref:Uncharacterized protein n=1 Tax=Myotis brandtii TaxID=109478 RepID=S7NTY7_MYOBR|nr:hypothetical protein D623_10021543 [Myotis brandtii]
MQMIESECFKDINESENEETRDLRQEDKTCQPKPAPKRKKGFFHRLLSRWALRIGEESAVVLFEPSQEALTLSAVRVDSALTQREDGRTQAPSARGSTVRWARP